MPKPLFERVADELSRMIQGGLFNEGFWQNAFNEDGRDQLYRDREARAYEARKAEFDAKSSTLNAQTVAEKRAARKLIKRAKVLMGLERLYKRDCEKDPQLIAYSKQSQWLSDARDVAIYLQRWRVGALKRLSERTTE